MMEWQLDIVSALAAWLGLTALCFQSAHQRQRLRLYKQKPAMRLAFLLIGIMMLAVSCQASITANGQDFGTLVFISQLGLIGLLLILALSQSTRTVLLLTATAAMGVVLLSQPIAIL
jgi:hypothetical protein